MFDNFFYGRKVLLTGHTGFKGSWLSLWLAKLGSDLTGFSLDPPTVPNLFSVCGIGRRMNSLTGDVRSLRDLLSVVDACKPEIVIHMAAQSLVNRSYSHPVETFDTNIMGTVNVLEACRRSPSVRAVINVTSDKCYENKDWAWGYRENDRLGGHDPYSSSKACSELVSDAYRRSFLNTEDYGLHRKTLVSVRSGNVIGGGDWAENRLIPDCMRSLSAGIPISIRYPGAVRPWQHVLESLHGYLLTAYKAYMDGPAASGAWNFGPSGRDMLSVQEIVRRVVTLWGRSIPVIVSEEGRNHESSCLRLDCSMARTVLGWNPQWDIDTALEKTVCWYKAHEMHEDMLEVTWSQIDDFERCIKTGSGHELQIL